MMKKVEEKEENRGERDKETCNYELEDIVVLTSFHILLSLTQLSNSGM
jgi:hypothetical protein